MEASFYESPIGKEMKSAIIHLSSNEASVPGQLSFSENETAVSPDSEAPLLRRDSRVSVLPKRVVGRASFLSQVSILSGRTLLNLYRNPFLLFAHYATSITLARNIYF